MQVTREMLYKAIKARIEEYTMLLEQSKYFDTFTQSVARRRLDCEQKFARYVKRGEKIYQYQLKPYFGEEASLAE